MTKIDEEALEKAFLAEPQSGEDWFDTVAGATGLTDEENRTLLRCAITAYLTALEAKGLGVLPLRPTEEMLERARDDNLVPFASRWHAREIYRTMVSAARGDG